MVRIKYVEYVYLFIRFAGDPNGIWLVNKLVLLSGGGILWGIIWLVCRKRVCFAG